MKLPPRKVYRSPQPVALLKIPSGYHSSTQMAAYIEAFDRLNQLKPVKYK